MLNNSCPITSHNDKDHAGPGMRILTAEFNGIINDHLHVIPVLINTNNDKVRTTLFLSVNEKRDQRDGPKDINYFLLDYIAQ